MRRLTGYSSDGNDHTEFSSQGFEETLRGGQREGLAPEAAAKLRAMITFLQDMHDPELLRAFPLWKPQQLTGARKGV
jgi:hypothetical protein